MTRSPINASLTVAFAPIEQSRPIRTSAPITAFAPITLPLPISAPAPITAPGLIDTLFYARAPVYVGARKVRRVRIATTDATLAEIMRGPP